MKQVPNEFLGLKHTVQSLTNRTNAAEDRISEIEDNQNESTQFIKHLEENLNRAKKTTQEMNDAIKRSNIRIIGLPEGVGRKTGLQELLNEIIQENFQNTGIIRATQIRKGQRTPNRSDSKRTSPRHVVFKLTFNGYKERILKQVRRQDCSYRKTNKFHC